MKIIILISLLFVGFVASSQINIESKYDWQNDSNYWETVKVINAVSGNNETIDPIEYIFWKLPKGITGDRIQTVYEYSIDSLSYLKKTNRIRAVVLRSRKVEIQRFVSRYTWTQLPNNPDEMIYKYLVKAKSLNINNNNVFWNYPAIDSIVHPEKYFVTDTIQ